MKPKKPTMRQVAEHIYKTDVLIASMMLKIRQLEEKVGIEDGTEGIQDRT